MDGSKRSRHSNAFFTGFGGFRKIVLFDTLIQQLAEPELEAVLATRLAISKRSTSRKLCCCRRSVRSRVFHHFVAGKQEWFTALLVSHPARSLRLCCYSVCLSSLVTFWFFAAGALVVAPPGIPGRRVLRQK